MHENNTGADEAAEILRVSAGAVRHRIRLGKIPHECAVRIAGILLEARSRILALPSNTEMQVRSSGTDAVRMQ
jgi:hypothetical protein